MYKNIVVPFRNFKLRTFTASMTDIIYVCFEAIALHTECADLNYRRKHQNKIGTSIVPLTRYADLNGSESVTYEGVGYRTSHEVRGFKHMVGVHFYRTPYGVRWFKPIVAKIATIGFYSVYI